MPYSLDHFAKTKRWVGRLALASLLVLFACDARRATRGDGGTVGPADSAPPLGDLGLCGCDPRIQRARCAGKVAETCVAGRWQRTDTCTVPQVCWMGQCLTYTVGCPDEIRYDGTVLPSLRSDPEPVSDCISGGDLGRDVYYSEKRAVTEPRGLITGRWGECPDWSARVEALNLSGAFGVNVNDRAVSGDDTTLWQVPPQMVGLFYRQIQRFLRVATLWRQGQIVGFAQLSDVRFVEELAVGAECPPPSKLPPAQGPPPSHCITHSDECSPCP